MVNKDEKGKKSDVGRKVKDVMNWDVEKIKKRKVVTMKVREKSDVSGEAIIKDKSKNAERKNERKKT